MTGFGAAAAEEQGFSARVEVRSLNHRYLQVKTRLPGEFQVLDPEVDSLVRKKLDRGAVTVNVIMQHTARPERAEVSTEVAMRYRQLLSELSQRLELEGDISLETLVQLPGVIGFEEDDRSLDLERKTIVKLVGQALAALISMRETEGENIEADLRKHATATERLVARIEKRMPKVVREHHQNLKQRLEELLDGKRPVSDNDLAREIGLLADRTDVSEELSRLRSHLDQLQSLLDKGNSKAIGRQLDFLIQEFMREANTIGSKCNDATVAHHVVELKTHIERLREQVQNVE